MYREHSVIRKIGHIDGKLAILKKNEETDAFEIDYNCAEFSEFLYFYEFCGNLTDMNKKSIDNQTAEFLGLNGDLTRFILVIKQTHEGDDISNTSTSNNSNNTNNSSNSSGMNSLVQSTSTPISPSRQEELLNFKTFVEGSIEGSKILKDSDLIIFLIIGGCCLSKYKERTLLDAREMEQDTSIMILTYNIVNKRVNLFTDKRQLIRVSLIGSHLTLKKEISPGYLVNILPTDLDTDEKNNTKCTYKIKEKDCKEVHSQEGQIYRTEDGNFIDLVQFYLRGKKALFRESNKFIVISLTNSFQMKTIPIPKNLKFCGRNHHGDEVTTLCDPLEFTLNRRNNPEILMKKDFNCEKVEMNNDSDDDTAKKRLIWSNNENNPALRSMEVLEDNKAIFHFRKKDPDSANFDEHSDGEHSDYEHSDDGDTTPIEYSQIFEFARQYKLVNEGGGINLDFTIRNYDPKVPIEDANSSASTNLTDENSKSIAEPSSDLDNASISTDDQ
ncbi:hypothetical protein TpMuguga_01g00462 [Theileria parva strain Muguga]|uniref:Uncharacterized protein n=1 Tax=Theileria parva TaxID=5875 RepID=Q4N8K9_THEPA|nr:uncharacterized protein TpMuguga_01g00462 [Theileria parva strain Muguga]EAN33699.1 hypothetical protein TpMuguga_01g00462 [Theileria parva strain Muguga]|eukprot:XP_765982.1 hypothetical protein [Theileria parva strain Muguga]